MTPLVSPTITSPAAFSRPAHAQAAAAAAQFGAVSQQRVQAIQADVVALLSQAASEHWADSGTPRGDTADRPRLRQADMARLQQNAARQAGAGSAAGRMTPEAAVGLFLSQLTQLLGTESLRDMDAQHALEKQRLAERAAARERLSTELRQAQSAVDAALGHADAAAGDLDAAVDALNAAEAEVARLKEELANATPEQEPELRAQLEAANRTATQAAQNVESARAALLQATAAADQALSDLETLQAEADSLDPPGSAPRNADGARTNAAQLNLLLAVLQEIIGKANDAKLKADTEFVRQYLQAREAENLRRSEEYQEQVAKAERTQKLMGCIGKIVGWVLTVVAVIAAPFSGGTSMVLAGIGLALAIGEELGLDIMGKVMEPIMKLVMEAVKAIGSVIADVLKAVGIPAGFADKIKDVLGVIVVAAMIVGAFLLSRKLAGNLAVQTITKAMTKAITRTLGKVLPQVLKSAGRALGNSVDDVAKAISKAVAKATGSSADTLAVRAGQAAKASQTLQFAHQTAQSAGAVVVADMYVNAAKLMAELELGLADTRIFRDLIQRLLEYFVQTNNLVAELARMGADVQAAQDETSRFVTARIAHA